MKGLNLTITGMSCNHCVMAVKKELSKLPLEKSEVAIGSAKIEYDESKTDLKKIVEAIEEAGFKVAN